MGTASVIKNHWHVPSSGLAETLHPLLHDLSTEVCIVGAGIAGLSTAYHLLRSGVSNVTVVDAHSLGEGETPRSSGHLTYALDEHGVKLAHIHGKRAIRNVLRSHAEAIETIETLIKTHSIECDFKRVDGYLFESEHFGHEDLERERQLFFEAGLDGVRLMNSGPIKGMRGFEGLSCLYFPRQAQLNPALYLVGLAQVVRDLGGKIYVNTPIVEIHGGSPASLVTKDANRITADAVVIAGNAAIGNKVSLVHKMTSYRTYAIAGLVPHGSVEEGLHWDSENPYHYVRVDTSYDGVGASEHDILLVGGEDHRTGQQKRFEDYFLALERWTRFHYPKFEWVTARWSGQIVVPHDGIAFIGRQASYGENVFVATAFSGNGLTYGTIAGMLLSDLIQGNSHPWIDLYDPDRIRVVATASGIRDNLNTVLQYRDWITSGEAVSVDEIRANEGRVLREGMTKVAIYRDPYGRLHRFSASCTHLGGLVRWNDAEKTWDCPCHGSRFDCLGTVLAGPATRDLERIETPSTHAEVSTPEKVEMPKDSAEPRPKMP